MSKEAHSHATKGGHRAADTEVDFCPVCGASAAEARPQRVAPTVDICSCGHSIGDHHPAHRDRPTSRVACGVPSCDCADFREAF